MHTEEVAFRNGGVALHAVADGPPDGTMVILLHGFPEFWYGWRHQIGSLAAAGFRVIVPDQRGYNLSDKPRSVGDYSMANLVSDVLCIIEQSGREHVFLVGHDWGALVAWCVAAWHPEKVRGLVIMNVPHPAAMQRFLLTRPRQLLRSWYVFFFQIPHLPELTFSARNFQTGVRSLVRSSRPGTFSEEALSAYRSAWARKGAVGSMINWYRALLRRPFAHRVGDIEVRTLILWGKKDAFLQPELAPASLKYCANGSLIWFEQATHWVQHEEPEAVNRALLKFLTR